ncbi:hypothetical protein MIB92_16365 [Aestuariirhabdus sp. Z084]|uniref:hypothetical protein n=1 Tax=Aestuariirhabdus haliotis TaxID=2918751 RepID=UPI00201B42B7|nr:hypothetical protein [Aestuariirhabdus haliotis]MCL6417236.1 hypothetical protein [Aestuariirhabdus haliotis]MCL6421199.1 hypothetical protein [Aestuariirhabdus haliotis]
MKNLNLPTLPSWLLAVLVSLIFITTSVTANIAFATGGYQGDDNQRRTTQDAETRNSVQGADEPRTVQDADARKQIQDADERRATEDADTRKTVQDAEERYQD